MVSKASEDFPDPLSPVITVKVLGSNSLGDHVIATVTLTMGAA